MSHFEVGKIYNTNSGNAVRIVSRGNSFAGEELVSGSDGYSRYNGGPCSGVVMGCTMGHVLSLVVPPPNKKPNFTLLVDELVVSWATTGGFSVNSPGRAARRVAARAALESAIHQLQKDSA